MDNANQTIHNTSPARTKGNKKLPKKVTETWLHNAGLHYLQRFSASRSRFRQVMMRKIERSCRAHPEQNIEDCARMLEVLIEKFTSSGFLNDSDYAQAQIRTRRRRGDSGRKIRARLTEKGIEENLLNEFVNDGDDFLSALRLMQRKRLGPFNRGRNEKKEKDMAVLARAGFSYETARRALEVTTEDAEKIIAESGCLP